MARTDAAVPPIASPSVEERTRCLASDVLRQVHRRQPTMFDGRWWEEQLLQRVMRDPAIKLQMFRFVDVLPMLKSHASVNRHLHEYFEEIRNHLPWAARLGLDISESNALLGRVVSYSARSNARRMATRFIAGSHVDDVAGSIRRLRDEGFATSLDLLGEAVISEAESDAYLDKLLATIRMAAPALETLPSSPQIDADYWGPIPRLNVSVKLSALTPRYLPRDPRGTLERLRPRLTQLLDAALEHHVFVNFDSEQFALRDLNTEIVRSLLMEPAYRSWPHVGVVVQAYHRDGADHLGSWQAWVRERGTPISVRLVKGAYWDYETVVARARGWPCPVFHSKWQSDAAFEELAETLLDDREMLRPAFASHNTRSLAHAVAYAQSKQIDPSSYEIQMLYGMSGQAAQVWAERGLRVRIYTPYGELIPGMAYLVRRLLENTSNDSFLKLSLRSDPASEELLMSPKDAAAVAPPPLELSMPAFENAPLTDFSDPENRAEMQAAIERVRDQLGAEYPLLINGKAVETRGTLIAKCPFDRSLVIGRIASAQEAHAEDAIDAARRTFSEWSRTPAHYRAEYLDLLATELSKQRLELAAWEVFECAKNWAEADADVAEAIDFCRYYADEMRRLSQPRCVDVPGEENRYFYRPRGVAVVIAPWNFPLAILVGMSTAALVAGNTVIMKPAEQASVVAAKWMEILGTVGLPAGACHYLPGVGEEVGPVLVGHPDVDVIAFTGSEAVGLEIHQQAAEQHASQRSVKRVVAEMGGKNAIIIDDDADLDEAVLGVVESAFGYSGQKCSACSRVIVLASIYDQFKERLTGAVAALIVGPADAPGTDFSAVIDEAAQERLQAVLNELTPEDAALVYRGDVTAVAGKGFYVAPHVFENVDPDGRLAQQELFGPILSMFRVKDFDEALKLANASRFALTGAVYSRSPVNLNRARTEFQVGNLYLNRPSTGALVNRQPFGGFRMSGIGSKAGGPDYLQQFLIPVNVTENTLRRGFAPDSLPIAPDGDSA